MPRASASQSLPPESADQTTDNGLAESQRRRAVRRTDRTKESRESASEMRQPLGRPCPPGEAARGSVQTRRLEAQANSKERGPKREAARARDEASNGALSFQKTDVPRPT